MIASAVRKAVNMVISMNIASRNRGYSMLKNTKPGVSCTDRIATSVPEPASAMPITIALHPSVMCNLRFLVAISSDCAKNSRNQAAMEIPCTATIQKIEGWIGLPSKCVRCRR